jgi:MFS transporter, DHA1 family, multidrug resistance protein
LLPSLYSFFFSLNAADFFAAPQLTGTLSERFGLKRLVRVAVTGYAVMMVGLLLIAASRVDRLDVLVLLLLAGNGFLGLVIPATRYWPWSTTVNSPERRQH